MPLKSKSNETARRRASPAHSRSAAAPRTQRYALTALAASLLLNAGSAFAAPGKPALKQWEITSTPHGFVEIDLQAASGATPYKKIVKLNKEVKVPLPFDIWSGDAPARVVAVVDGVVDPSSETRLTSGARSGQVRADVKTPGRKKMQVRAYGEDGTWTDSDPLEVMVFDTIPELADDLPDNVDRRNKQFVKSKDKVVGTYFTTWSVYGRNYSVDQVPLDNLTHILYGFIPICGANINEGVKAAGQPYQALVASCQGLPDFSVTIHDSWAEIGKQLPGQNGNSKLKGVLGQMMAAKKRNPDLKVLPSIGGWTLSDPFFRMHDPANRKVFVDSVENLLRTWKFFDGVDIDWEFPGGNGATKTLGNRETDGQLYVTLMKELREMLDRLSAEYGKSYELTSAIGSPPEKVNVVPYKQATQYMDYLFDMTYDYYGAWDMKELGHMTALHAPRNKPDTKFTTHHSVQALLAQGVDPKKIVVGVAKYGRGWTGVSGYRDDNPFTGTATGPHAGQWEKGIMDYKKIASDMLGPSHSGINGYEYRYDQDAEAPYVFNKSTGDLLSFDDARSVIAKGNYVLANDLGGVFSWEIDADNGDILNAMNQGIGNKERTASDPVAPIARAVANVQAKAGHTARLDASASSQAAGAKLAFQWKQISGEPLKIRDAGRAVAMVDVPEVTTTTKYAFQVTVTEPSGLSATARTVLTAEPGDKQEDHTPPVAQLTGPTIVQAGQRVTLSATGSLVSKGKTLTYVWTTPQGITATRSGASLTFIAPALAQDKSFAFAVTVNDGKLSSRAQHQVVVKAKAKDPGQDTGKGTDQGKGTDPGKGTDQGKGDKDGGQAGAHPAYKAGATYKAGDIVTHGGDLYQCKPFPNSGWCSVAPQAYEPGRGWAWKDAWLLYSAGGQGDSGTGGHAGAGGDSSQGGDAGTGSDTSKGGDASKGSDTGKGSDTSQGGNAGTGSDTGKDGNAGKGADTGKGSATAHPVYKEGTAYQAGDIVSNAGKLFRCKPFPYSGWCSGAAWAYEPGTGSAWNQAWDEHKD